MKMLCLSLASVAVLTSFSSAHASGNTTFGTLISLNAGDNVQIVGNLANDPDACGDTDLYILDGEHPNFKNLYAGLLTALSSGATVRLNVDGCIANAAMTKSRPSVNSITVKP